MMLTVMSALSVLCLSSLTISSCDLCKTVLGGWGFGFEFVAVAVYMSDLTKRNILTIPKYPEHVCLTACVGLPGLQGPNTGLHNLTSTGPLCPISGTATIHLYFVF